jgi:SAM-dependent methyltransferase
MAMSIEDERISHEKEHGKKISDHAEEVWGWTSPGGKLRANRRANYFITLGKYTKQSTILEIGCGTGLFTEKVFSATKANITSIDISEALLNKAKIKLPQVSFKVEDAMHMSFPNSVFDAVFGSSILHHLDMKKSLMETYRVLKTGGNIVFAEPNMLNPQKFIQKNVPFIKRWMGDSPDETAIIRWKMQKMLKEIGYRSLRVFPYDFLHPATPAPLMNTIQAIGKMVEKLPLVKEIAGSVIIYAEK